MPMEQKMNFKIKVREIDFGFISTLENQNGVEMREMWCKDSDSIIGQIRTWIDEIFKEKEENK